MSRKVVMELAADFATNKNQPRILAISMLHPLLFVTGQGKTGTSTLVGMLNTHPSIFLLYEANLGANPRSRRAEQFLKCFPDFSVKLGDQGSFPDSYHQLADFLTEAGHPYHFVGDKILTSTFTSGASEAMAPHRVIFVVRDLRTWLCKNVVISHFMKEESIASRAFSYVDQYLSSFLLPQCLRISMEEMVEKNTEVIALLSGFLQIDLRDHAREWWNKVDQWPAGDPKAAVNWWEGHDSSKLQPRGLDTKAVLKSHPFWDDVLPIFDRYYHGRLAYYSPEQIAQDRAQLARIQSHNVVLTDLYAKTKSVSFGSGWFGGWGHRSKNPHVKPHETR